MGIRFKSDHLTCPACGAAYTPLNRREPNPEPVREILTRTHPQWDSADGACEECVNKAYRHITDTSLIGKLRNRLLNAGEKESTHRYRTIELV